MMISNDTLEGEPLGYPWINNHKRQRILDNINDILKIWNGG